MEKNLIFTNKKASEPKSGLVIGQVGKWFIERGELRGNAEEEV